VVGPRGLTRKGPEVTVRSTSPSRAFCAGLLGDGDRQGRSRVCRASFEVEHAASRWIRYPGEIPGTPGGENEGGRKSMQKVRLKP
jgi:hypothetical protein